MLFLIGAVFGMRVRRGGDLFDARTVGCALAANALAGIALPVVCYLRYPAWMWGYYVEPEFAPPALVVFLFVLYWVPFLIGYVVPRRLESLRPGAGWAAIVLGAAAQIALIAWQWPRYSRIGSLDAWRAGEAVAPSEVPLVAWGGPAAVAAVGVLLFLAKPVTASARK